MKKKQEIMIEDTEQESEARENRKEQIKEIVKVIPKATLVGIARGLVIVSILQDIQTIGGIHSWKTFEPIIMETSPFENGELNLSKVELSNQMLDYATPETAYLGQLLSENKNVQNEEEIKEIFRKYMSTYISENPYFDYDLAYARLMNLDIIDNPILNKIDNFFNPNTLAFYRNDNNTLHFLNFSSQQENNVIFHELLHSITFKDPTVNFHSTFITEGMTALLTREYTTEEYKDPSNISHYFSSSNEEFYTGYTTVCKILCELLGENVMLQAYSTGDYNLLVTEMNNIIGEKETQEVFDCLGMYSRAGDHDSEYGPEAKEYVAPLIRYFNMIYEEKYGYDHEENDVLNDYYRILQNPFHTSRVVKFYYSSEMKMLYPESYLIKSEIDENPDYIYMLDENTNTMREIGQKYSDYSKTIQYYFQKANDPILQNRSEQDVEQSMILK